MKETITDSKNKGFSLLELVIVISVLSILSAIGISSYICVQKRAKAISALVTIKQIQKECSGYVDTGNNKFFRAASESAMRAVNHPECKKLKVPKKKYDTWNEIILDFDPSQSLN